MLPWVLRTVGLPKRRNRITTTCSSVPDYEATDTSEKGIGAPCAQLPACDYSHSMRESDQYLLAYGLASELRRRKDLHRAHKVFGANRLFVDS